MNTSRISNSSVVRLYQLMMFIGSLFPSRSSFIVFSSSACFRTICSAKSSVHLVVVVVIIQFFYSSRPEFLRQQPPPNISSFCRVARLSFFGSVALPSQLLSFTLIVFNGSVEHRDSAGVGRKGNEEFVERIVGRRTRWMSKKKVRRIKMIRSVLNEAGIIARKLFNWSILELDYPSPAAVLRVGLEK